MEDVTLVGIEVVVCAKESVFLFTEASRGVEVEMETMTEVVITEETVNV